MVPMESAPEALTAEVETTYDRRTARLHWATAVLVTVLWVIAQVIDWFPKGVPRICARSVHITVGVLLGVVLVRRIVWRSRSGRRLPPANPGVWGHAARSMHRALYAGLAAVVVLGMLNAWARGDSIFSLLHIPKLLPANAQLQPAVEYLHKTFANALLILAGAHALAALAHHFILGDGLLLRMLPWLGQMSGASRFKQRRS
jgi:cytochrome b561